MSKNAKRVKIYVNFNIFVIFFNFRLFMPASTEKLKVCSRNISEKNLNNLKVPLSCLKMPKCQKMCNFSHFRDVFSFLFLLAGKRRKMNKGH